MGVAPIGPPVWPSDMKKRRAAQLEYREYLVRRADAEMAATVFGFPIALAVILGIVVVGVLVGIAS